MNDILYQIKSINGIEGITIALIYAINTKELYYLNQRNKGLQNNCQIKMTIL